MLQAAREQVPPLGPHPVAAQSQRGQMGAGRQARTQVRGSRHAQAPAVLEVVARREVGDGAAAVADFLEPFSQGPMLDLVYSKYVKTRVMKRRVKMANIT